MNETLSFQDIMARLIAFWKSQGCLALQPHNVQVGAGTMNPATALRVLGPEPWNVVYVEPSIRPDDGRFGDNPNRMQMHHQLQVILKPDPGNPQELYLQSLEAIGIRAREHDIRFVEDNWESPALGAWGLGWEVWLDGQEITQFTYFQQAGGINLDPVCVEITYGLDRITLALQRKRSVWEIDYGVGVPYGDLLLQSEIEHCRYYFQVADVDALRTIYDLYEREAQRCLEQHLIAPAHDYNLKCSHLFNVLDTRGAIGVTERANYFKRMRAIARQVAEQYLEQRTRLEYPLLEHTTWKAPATTRPAVIPTETPPSLSEAQTFVLEIGVEELPPQDVAGAVQQLRTLVPEVWADCRLTWESIEVDGTPRRLVIITHGLAPRQSDLETEVKGPPADRAFDQAGQPTQAGLGFAQSRGVDVSDLRVVTHNGKRYVAALVRQAGRPTPDVLAETLPDLLARLRFDKSMRWNSSNISFSRPVRWFVALFGAAIIPFEYAGVASGRITHGLRPYGSPPVVIPAADQYEAIMQAQGIMWRAQERMEHIQAGVHALAIGQHGRIPPNPDLLEEVTQLVEAPQPFVGRFEARYLALPADILVAVMRKHQRYFPVYAPEGALLPFFIAVRNGDAEHLDLVADGNEQVIKARFADAEFFYNQDRTRPLSEFVHDLDSLTFQADLGSMGDKARRLMRLTPLLAQRLGLSSEESAIAEQAASLAKADLATTMVVEMTSLQGIMGGHYARLSGESEAVAAAIAEQYNSVSQTRPGLALALADRLDSLVGLTAVGLLPKGSNDPFALRRAAIHIIENLCAHATRFDVYAASLEAAAQQPRPAEAAAATVAEFVQGRLEVWLRERGFKASVVKATLAEQGRDPYQAWQMAGALTAAIQEPDWPGLLDAYARCVRIIRNQPAGLPLRPADLALPQEQKLYAAYVQAVGRLDGTLATFVAALRELEPAITLFFDQVLVMDEDPAVRENRLALLQHIAALTRGLADLSHLEGF